MREETRPVVNKPSSTCLGDVKIQEAILENYTIIQDCKDKHYHVFPERDRGKPTCHPAKQIQTSLLKKFQSYAEQNAMMFDLGAAAKSGPPCISFICFVSRQEKIMGQSVP